MIDMARVRHAASIDITAWNFFEDEDIWRDLLAAGYAVYINKTLCQVLEESPPNIWFAWEWNFGEEKDDGVGGKCPDDPVTLYLGLPLGAEDDSVCWSISLESIVDSLIEDSIARGKIKDEHATNAIKIAARLREIADKLEGATE